MPTPDARRRLLTRLFEAGLAAARPRRLVRAALEAEGPFDLVIAAGKAAAEMAQGACEAGVTPRAGLLATRRGEAPVLPAFTTIGAAHPLPDAESMRAGVLALELARRAGSGGRALVLISGGASALLCAPAPGVDLETKRTVTAEFLRQGRRVEELNAVRRRLSALKGGRLAAALHPAQTLTLALSDVVSDAPHEIGSGPTVGDPTDRREAVAALEAAGLSELAPLLGDSLPPGDPRLAASRFRLLGGSGRALEASAAAAAAAGRRVVRLGDALVGEGRDLGTRHAEAVRAALRSGIPTALISGGEAVTTVRGPGRGGPNLEYAAALALALEGETGFAVLAGDTDGIDGTSGACGAYADGDSARRARAAGRPLEAALMASDTAEAFGALGDLFAPGFTGTNVNDLRIILADPDG